MNITRFELRNRKDYYKYKDANNDYIEVKNRFGNGYVLTDRFNTITADLVEQYNLKDDSSYFTDGSKDYNKYYIKDLDTLKDFINSNQNLKFVCLYKIESEI